LGSVLEKTIREGRSHHGGEVPIACGPVAGGGAEERQICGRVVPDREFVVAARAQKTVAGAVAVLDTSPLVGMIWVGVPAAGEGFQVMCGVALTVVVDVVQPILSTVCTGQPTEVVIKRTVFHHHHHDMVDPGLLRSRQRARR
jgi:hypothetical protein